MLCTNLSASSHNGDPDSLDQSISHHAREQFLLYKQRGLFGRASQRLSIITQSSRRVLFLPPQITERRNDEIPPAVVVYG